MMNVLAICLVFTSLLGAEILSPVPEKNPLNQKDEDVKIVKEGHRIVVVETYDEYGQHNTKVSISPEQPQQQQQQQQEATVSESADKGTPGEVESNNNNNNNNGEGRHATPGELTCDAFGKCTSKIASVIGKAKEMAHEAVAQQKEMVKETAEEAVARESEMAREAKEKVEGAYEKAMESASEKVHVAKEAFEKAKESAAHKAHDVEENVKESAGGSLDKAKDMGKKIENDVVPVLSEKMEHTKEQVAEKAKEAKEKTEQAKEKVWRFVNDAVKSVYSTEVLNSLMGVANLLGFATAYGMCVWVTFVSSYVLAGALPRQQFALVQSKIYPVYFRAMAYCVGVTLLAHLVGKRKLLFTSAAVFFQGYNLVASVSMVLFNAMYLEPLATEVMFERMKIEKEEGRGRESQATESDKSAEGQPAIDPAVEGGTSTTREEALRVSRQSRELEDATSKMVRLSHRLKKLNSYSSLLNILTLMALTWHLVYLAQCLHVTC